MARLPASTFELPIPEIRAGYYTASYFWRSKKVIETYPNWLEDGGPNVIVQVFNKIPGAVVCGIDEALAILSAGMGYWSDRDKAMDMFKRYIEEKKKFREAMHGDNGGQKLSSHHFLYYLRGQLNALWVDTHRDCDVFALEDGMGSKPYHGVMEIHAKARDVVHLESLYLGVLARATRVATNTNRTVRAANGKPVLFFADRFDRWCNQTADGYAAYIGGIKGIASDSMGEWWGGRSSGTTPHFLIACFMGETAEATLAFANAYPDSNVIALVDFHNDCVNTSLEVARVFSHSKHKLWGIRLDTSPTLVDKCLHENLGTYAPNGVCAELVRQVRAQLNVHGHKDVKIVVSGGFNVGRIASFENQSVPVDAYGVGSSLLSIGTVDYTADVVQVRDTPMAKVGRQRNRDSLIKMVDWEVIDG